MSYTKGMRDNKPQTKREATMPNATENIATTIYRQIGGGKFVVMTGAKNLTAHENALSMRLPKGIKNKANYLKITLDPSDTYTMEFGRIWGTKYTVIETVEGVHCDMLVDIFESKTGFFTTL